MMAKHRNYNRKLKTEAKKRFFPLWIPKAGSIKFKSIQNILKRNENAETDFQPDPHNMDFLLAFSFIFHMTYLYGKNTF